MAAGTFSQISDTTLAKAVASLKGGGHTVEGHEIDVVDYDSVLKKAHDAAAAGHVDATVHTAGVSTFQATPRQIFEVDSSAQPMCSMLSPPRSMRASLVCVASMAGYAMPFSPDLEQHHLAISDLKDFLTHKEIDFGLHWRTWLQIVGTKCGSSQSPGFGEARAREPTPSVLVLS